MRWGGGGGYESVCIWGGKLLRVCPRDFYSSNMSEVVLISFVKTKQKTNTMIIIIIIIKIKGSWRK